jgi:putative ABC transport system substrate-binding protein
MRRRDFVSLVGGTAAILLTGAAGIWPLGARAQDAPKKIGFVSWFSDETAAHVEQFRRGMRDLGYVEERDFSVESHFTNGDRERTREAIRKLVQEGTDILVVVATPAIAVAKQEAGSLPVVMGAVSDPIAAGFAQSLPRPGGTITGRTMFGPELTGKRIDLIREIRPGLRTLAFLGSSTDANTVRFVNGTQAEADRSGLKLIVKLVDGPKALDAGTFEALRREEAEAVIVQPIFAGNQTRIVTLATEAGLPVIADFAMFADAGAVLTYGIDMDANMYRAAYFVDRVFEGASPAELPIEQPTETKLAVNLVAAEGFGWVIPPTVLARADEIIE